MNTKSFYYFISSSSIIVKHKHFKSVSLLRWPFDVY